jgi:hypothetical protein
VRLKVALEKRAPSQPHRTTKTGRPPEMAAEPEGDKGPGWPVPRSELRLLESSTSSAANVIKHFWGVKIYAMTDTTQ